jgi:glutaredoxin
MDSVPFIEPELNKFTIYSKSGCPNCVKAKTLLKDKGLPFLIVDCDEYILENKAEFLQFIEKKALTEWKSFPIIFDDINFVGNKFVGGFVDLKVYLESRLDFTDLSF